MKTMDPVYTLRNETQYPAEIFLTMKTGDGQATVIKFTATASTNATWYDPDLYHSVIVGISVPLAVLIFLLIFLYWHIFEPMGKLEEKKIEETFNATRREIKLKMHNQLAEGRFGQLHLATAHDIIRYQKETPVVVQMLRASPTEEQKDSFKKQRHLLRKVGRHVNIVNLLGIVYDRKKPEKSKLLMEYCFFGNLVDYLQRQRKTFWNQVDNDILDISKCKTTDVEFPIKTQLDTTKIPKEYSGPYKVNGTCSETGKNSFCPLPQTYFQLPTCDGKPLSTLHLICFAIQIIDGVKYLLSKQVFHKDLAARNVLVASTNIMKICDFESPPSSFRSVGKVLPFKWMALESLRGDGDLSQQSLVWSFGVLLWELFTLAEEPYTNIYNKTDVLRYLEANKRLDKPAYCPKNIYGIMENCWKQLPDSRPDFASLSSRFAIVKSDLAQRCFGLNRQYLCTVNAVTAVNPSDSPELPSLKQIRARKSLDVSMFRSNETEQKQQFQRFSVTTANGKAFHSPPVNNTNTGVYNTFHGITPNYSESSSTSKRSRDHYAVYDNSAFEEE